MKPVTPPALLTVLGIDGSTEDTGLAILQFDRQGCIKVIATTHFVANVTHKNSKTARLSRIVQTCDKMQAWIYGSDLQAYEGIDCLAYEWHTERNPDVSEALSQASGHYVATLLYYYPNRSVCRVSPQTARAVYSRKNLTREDKKPEAIAWAKRELGLPLTDTDDAIADACAVCFAAWGVWRRALVTGENKPLPRVGSGKQRKVTA